MHNILFSLITSARIWRKELSVWVLSLSLSVFYVTCTDISVIYVTAQICRRTEEEVVPTVGRPRHNQSSLTTRWGYGGRILDLNPRVLTKGEGGGVIKDGTDDV